MCVPGFDLCCIIGAWRLPDSTDANGRAFRPALSVAAIDVGGYPVLGKQDLAGLHSISDCYVDEGFVAREQFFFVP